MDQRANSQYQSSILIVDDLLDNLRVLRDTLTGQGYKVRSCKTGAMALRGAKAAACDLILLDIKLPDYDGYEICRQLKADEQTAHIPVIFLSALNNTFDKIKGFSVGGADYITKPFQVEEVLARVATHLSIQQLQKNLQQQNLLLTQEIQERKRIEEALFIEKELAQVTLNSIGDAVITTDSEGNIQYINPVAEHLTGWSQQEAKNLPLAQIFQIFNEQTNKIVENPLNQALEQDKITALPKNSILITRQNTSIPIDDSAAPLKNSKGETIGGVIVFRDITEARNLTRQLQWQANHDSLTGLINRFGFEEQLEQAISAAKNNQEHDVLCYLDLDQFKVINDTCGHAAGDELLRQVTIILHKGIPPGDILARLGGDEFAFLLHQCSLETATEIANNVRILVEQFRFFWNKKIFKIAVSIGVVAINHVSQDKNTVLSLADSACYAAKNKGRNCVHVYDNNDQELLSQRRERQWVVEINNALEQNFFCLYYQKITPIIAKSESGYYEILLRLKEGSKLISPGVFIPAAERYGLMPAVDRWVIGTFFQKYHNHYCESASENNFNSCLYSINISGASICNKDFLNFLIEQFNQYKVLPEKICFEITETTAIANYQQAIKLITGLKTLGCRFAIDDFGHGMNSFDYLKNLPVDYLKIDGNFVKNIVNSPVDSAIVESFHRIGKVMNLKTVAEFVENEAILAKLEAIGIDYAQGYVISKPSPLEFP